MAVIEAGVVNVCTVVSCAGWRGTELVMSPPSRPVLSRPRHAADTTTDTSRRPRQGRPCRSHTKPAQGTFPGRGRRPVTDVGGVAGHAGQRRGAGALTHRAVAHPGDRGADESRRPACTWAGSRPGPVEAEPRHARSAVPLDSPVAVSYDAGHDGKAAPVLVIALVPLPGAAFVDHLDPGVIAGVERRPASAV